MERPAPNSPQQIRKVIDLVNSVSVNVSVYSKIYEFLGDGHVTKNNRFLLLSANNSFEAAVSSVSTLLDPVGEQELGIIHALEKEYSADSEGPSWVTEEDAAIYLNNLLDDTSSQHKLALFFSQRYGGRPLGDVMRELCRCRSIKWEEDLQTLKKKYKETGLLKVRTNLLGIKQVVKKCWTESLVTHR